MRLGVVVVGGERDFWVVENVEEEAPEAEEEVHAVTVGERHVGAMWGVVEGDVVLGGFYIPLPDPGRPFLH